MSWSIFFSSFEIEINDKYEKKNKNVAFKDDVEEDEDHVEGDTNDNLIESIALIEKVFGKIMRRLDKRSMNNVTNNVRDNLSQNSKGFNP